MTKKALFYSLLSFILFFQFSCDDKEMKKEKCFAEVKFRMDYCPVKGAVLVSFTEKNLDADVYGGGSNSVTYVAALLNVPESFRTAENVFYITYHPAKDSEIVHYQGACPANISYGVKVLIVDSISSTDCNQ